MSKTSGFTIPSLDGIRAVSILIVFAGHAALPTHIKGSSGVTVFFFLSGYLITTLLRREQDRNGSIALGAFYLRRVLRIFPPMYAALALALLLALIGAVPDEVTPGAQAASALHATNYWIVFQGREGLTSTMYALWSLAVEEHFYLLFPLLLIGLSRWTASRRKQAAVLTGICVAILLWRILLYADGASFDRLYLATDTRADSILWGCVLALVANPVMDRVRGSGRLWSLVALPAAVVVFWLAQAVPDSLALTVGYTVQAFCLAVAFTAVVAFPRSWAGRLLNWRPLAYLGVLSYSFYLLHRIALVGLEERTELSPYAVAAVGFVLSVAGAFGFRVLIERPFETLRRRLARSNEATERDRVAAQATAVL